MECSENKDQTENLMKSKTRKNENQKLTVYGGSLVVTSSLWRDWFVFVVDEVTVELVDFLTCCVYFMA